MSEAVEKWWLKYPNVSRWMKTKQLRVIGNADLQKLNRSGFNEEHDGNIHCKQDKDLEVSYFGDSEELADIWNWIEHATFK